MLSTAKAKEKMEFIVDEITLVDGLVSCVPICPFHLFSLHDTNVLFNLDVFVSWPPSYAVRENVPVLIREIPF